MNWNPTPRARWSTAAVALVFAALCATARASNVAEEDATITAKAAKDLLDQAKDAIKDRDATSDELRHALGLLLEAHVDVAGKASEKSAVRKKAEGLLVDLMERQLPRKGHAAPDTAVDVLRASKGTIGKLVEASDVDARGRLSRKIRALIERFAEKTDPNQWDQESLDALFDPLPLLDDPKTLAWLMEEYNHTKRRELPFLIAAHRVMPQFRNVSGRLRYEICDTFITAYGGTELRAKRVSGSPADAAAKQFWDALRPYTIPLLQHFAGNPKNEKGVALSTVREFQSWWRDHKDRRKAPWTD